MSADPATGNRPAAVTAPIRELASAPGAPAPPQAKQVPSARTFHGDTVTDPYAWLLSQATWFTPNGSSR